MIITSRQLREVVPGMHTSNIPKYLPLLNGLEVTSINTLERFCCFIAQTAYESASFNCTIEMASGKAYEGRSDLGNIIPGDGVKFKGRGLIQITGRDNYQACSKALFNDERLLEDPTILEQPVYAMLSAIWYWEKNKLNEICDYPDDWVLKNRRGRMYNKFQYLTLKINGGLNGFSERLEFYKQAKEILECGSSGVRGFGSEKRVDVWTCGRVDVKTMYDYELSNECGGAGVPACGSKKRNNGTMEHWNNGKMEKQLNDNRMTPKANDSEAND